MKKIIFGMSVFMMTFASAQNYPDYYPNYNNSNGSYYGSEEDAYYFPEDYYYEYPEDYYSNDLYQSYYDDYRQSIATVNWNRFFRNQRLSSWQVQEIMRLNDSFASYAAWNSFYRYNPDRWYYDRFYALQRILGPSVFVVFQNNYYNGYNPVVYYQNYNRRHYARNIYVIPHYRNVNVNVYRVNRTQFHQNNSRANIGFQPSQRLGSTQVPNTRNNGFRNGITGSGTQNGALRGNTSLRNDSRSQTPAFRTEQTVSPRSNSRPEAATNTRSQNNSGFRNSAPQRVAPQQKMDNSRNGTNGRNDSRRPGTTSRNSGQRFTAR